MSSEPRLISSNCRRLSFFLLALQSLAPAKDEGLDPVSLFSFGRFDEFRVQTPTMSGDAVCRGLEICQSWYCRIHDFVDALGIRPLIPEEAGVCAAFLR